MEIQRIFEEGLRVPWVAGTREKALNKATLLKYRTSAAAPLLAQDVLTFSLRSTAILLRGFCIILLRTTEFLVRDLSRTLETPPNNDTKRRQSCRSSVSRALGRSTKKLDTPQSVEMLRTAHQARPEEITISEAGSHPSLNRESLAYRAELEKSLLEDHFALDIELPAPLELDLATPLLAPARVRGEDNASLPTIKKRRRRVLVDEEIVLAEWVIANWEGDTADIVLDMDVFNEFLRKPKLNLGRSCLLKGHLLELWDKYTKIEEPVEPREETQGNLIDSDMQPLVGRLGDSLSPMPFTLQMPAFSPCVDSGFSSKMNLLLEDSLSATVESIAENRTRAGIAQSLLNCLVLARSGHATLTQASPFSPIYIRRLLF